MRIIIDAYNLIFAWGWMPRQEGAFAPEIARNRLLQRLRSLIPPQHRNKISIVFDAKSQSAEKRPVPYGNQADGFQLLFAHQYTDADSMIEELIAKEPDPQHLIVVSSDHRIRTAAARRNAISITSQDWLDQISVLFLQGDPTGFNAPGTISKDQSIQQLDGTDWLTEFGLKETEHPSDSIHANRDMPINDDSLDFNPFPPGYGEDLLDEF